MIKKFSKPCLILALVFSCSAATLAKADETDAFAHPAPDAFEQNNSSKQKTLRPVTVFEPVPQSSSDLINGGARVLSADIGMGGPTVFLMKDNKYILCGIHPAQDSLTNEKNSTSECYRLN